MDYENGRMERPMETALDQLSDRLVGLNITRALSYRYDARLSAGRVQTPLWPWDMPGKNR